MKEIIYNDDNLVEDKIIKKQTKIRAVLISSKNKIILANYNGVYLFPGGGIEDGELKEDALKREIKQELGIEIFLENKKPSIVVKQLIKNYPDRKSNCNVDRVSTTYYYLIELNNYSINSEKISLTESEKSGNFITFLVDINNASSLILNNRTENPRNKYFAREALVVIQELQKICNREEKDFEIK
ncbi:MAG: NUDIX hydrolase [Oscillospiraceae bacterium]|nr:NUDIX hydrolase [Oscillospiraceae bacterium]